MGSAEVRPEVVERVIAALPGVREVVVLQSSDSEMKAVVVAPGQDAETLRQWCRDRLPSEYRPNLIELWDELPRSPAGKILHKYMRNPGPAPTLG
jgi:long-chain acyl-CoA synthetase